MPSFQFIFPFSLLLVCPCEASSISSDPHGCPSSNYCMGSTSQIADLICYSYRSSPGLDYAIIGFGNELAGVCTVFYNCQPGKKAELRILQVIGYLVRLKSRYKTENGTYEYGSNLWFIDESVPSCPGFYNVSSLPFTGPGTFISGTSFLPLAANLIYSIYVQIFETLECECNTFSAEPSKSCRAYSRVPYFMKKPIAIVGLEGTKCAYANYFRNNSAVSAYINNYEVSNVDLNPLSTPLLISNPPIFRESVTVGGYDTTPNCKDFRQTMSVSDVLETYDYYVNCLDRYSFNKVVNLYAQGPNPQNCKNGQANCTRDSGSITNFCSINFLPSLSGVVRYGTKNQDADAVGYWQLNGFCPDSIVKTILGKLL